MRDLHSRTSRVAFCMWSVLHEVRTRPSLNGRGERLALFNGILARRNSLSISSVLSARGAERCAANPRPKHKRSEPPIQAVNNAAAIMLLWQQSLRQSLLEKFPWKRRKTLRPEMRAIPVSHPEVTVPLTRAEKRRVSSKKTCMYGLLTGLLPLYQFQVIGMKLNCRSLTNEIESQQHRRHTVTFLNPSFHALQGTGLDLDTASQSDLRRESDFQFRVERTEDFFKLTLKHGLVVDNQEVRHIIALIDLLSLLGLQLEEHVTRKERFGEDGGFSAVFVGRTVTRQRDAVAFPFAVFLQFLLAPRSRMRNEPCQFMHEWKCDGESGPVKKEVRPETPERHNLLERKLQWP